MGQRARVGAHLHHLGIIQPFAQHLLDKLEDLLQHHHHRVGSLWHWQLPELRAFMIILMMTDVQCGEEVGEKPQDVDNGQLVGGIRLWGEENQVLDLPVPACPLAPALTASSSPTPP